MVPFSVKSLLNKDEHLKDNVVFVSQSGSYLFDLNDEQSDFDYFVLAKNTVDDYNLGGWDQYRVTLSDVDAKVMSVKQFISNIRYGRFEALQLLCADRLKYSYCTETWKYVYDNAASVINKEILLKKAKGFMLDVLVCNRKDFLANKTDGSKISADVLNERIRTATTLGIYHVMSDADKNFDISVSIRNADLKESYMELKKVANILRDFNSCKTSVKKRSKHKEMAYAVLMGLIATHVLSNGNFEFELKDSDLAVLRDIKAGKYLTEHGVTNTYMEIVYRLIKDMEAAYNDSKLPSVEESEASYKKMLKTILYNAVEKNK